MFRKTRQSFCRRIFAMQDLALVVLDANLCFLLLTTTTVARKEVKFFRV